ncbi:TrbI/VirB10 family protein [Sphingopyxis sp.]|uniref:TrbI/VirB10 family protein n=1 Tax=Sphingopyxis sp. TaxID=1908224 RepID=UPI003D6D19D2
MSGAVPAEPANPVDRGEESPVAPPSADGFRLGAKPPRVMRLSRKALAGVGAVAAFGIGGALLWALQPTSPKDPENLYSADSRHRPDALSSAPAGYDKVPKLGPPLPGDLGRPIVAAQREGEVVPVPPIGAPPSAVRDPADEARERATREREAARSSRLFLASGGVAERAIASATHVPAPPSGGPAPGTPVSERRAFLVGGAQAAPESNERIRSASSRNILQAGSIIPAALITGIRSDLPGQVTAQVTQNVYDSPTGRILLIPQGSRLIGDYDSAITTGQNRVLLAWDRLILPGGRSIQLARQPGSDAAGMAGLSDRTNYHWGQVFRAALVSTLLGIGAELGDSGDDRIARAIREGSQDSIGQTGRSLVERQAAIAPTLTIRPGYQFRVIVTRDLIFETVAGGLG